jgi:polysaccharide transporter, PST family
VTLIKTSLVNAIAVVIKMLTLLGINKVLAIYVGPSGYALVGQLQTFVQSTTLLATAGTANGIVKYTSENQGDLLKQKEYWAGAVLLSAVITILLSCILFLFPVFLSDLLFKDDGYSYVFKCLAGSLIFFAFNSILLSVLNGMKEVFAYVKATVLSNLVALIVVVFLVYKYSLTGALIALVTYQSLSFFATLAVCYRYEWFDIIAFAGKPRGENIRSLLKYSLMALTSAVVVPMSQLLIRGDLITQFGYIEAGYWEAIWRLSAAYLMFVTGVLTFYFLPKFSELSSGSAIKVEIINGYKLIIPFMIVSSLLIYLGKNLFVTILFSKEFMPALRLLPMQLVGDVMRVSCWVVGFVMLGKAMTRAYIFSEIFFSSLFFCLSYILTRMVGLGGVTYAYCLNYFFYGLFLYIVVWKRYLGGLSEV